jgi:hypothetical protein
VDANRYQLSETVSVAASPEAVYDLVSDITRMGEWSPVCTGGSWDDEGRAWFIGTNKREDMEYETRCRVEADTRGEEFTFVNCGMEGKSDMVRWSYTFVTTASGCDVSESWQVLPAMLEMMADGMGEEAAVAYLDETKVKTRDGIVETLGKLKTAAEG